MSVSARDLYFILRVRDEASNVLTGVSRDILKIGAAAQASSARAEAAARRQQAASVRAAGAARVEAMRSAEAATREQAARMRAAGATRNQVTALDAQARAYAREATTINNATNKEVAALKRQASGFDEQAKALERNVAGHQRLARTMSDVSSAVTMGGLAMAGLGIVGAAALMKMVKAGIEYDRQVALTKTQTDGFKTSLQELGQVGKDVGKEIAIPFEELQPALFDIFSSTSANVKEATVLLKAFAKAGVAGQVSIQDASRSTMSIMNAFKIPFTEVNTVLDKQFQLVRKGVGTYGEFSKVIGKLTPSAVRLGQDLNTMDATLIFLTRNGLNTSSAVASAARAFDALANPKTTKKLENMGIKVRDVKGRFLPLIDILKGMKKALLELPGSERAEAISDIFESSGGTIQAKRFFNLVLPTAKDAGSLDQFEGFLKDMERSSGQFGAAYAEMANTVAAKSQLLKNNWDILKTTVGQALEPAFSRLLDIGNKIIGFFNNLTPQQQKQAARWALLATAITTVVGIGVVLLGGLGALAAALAALGLSLGAVVVVIGGAVLAIAALGGIIYAAYTKSQPLRQLFTDIGQTFTQVLNDDIKPFINEIKQGFEQNLLPALNALWLVLDSNVFPALEQMYTVFGKNFVSSLKEILNWTRAVANKGMEYIGATIKNVLIPVINQLTKFYYQHKSAIDTVIAALVWLGKWIVKIAGTAILVALIAIIVGTINVFSFLVKATLDVVHVIGILIGWIVDAWRWATNLRDRIGDLASGLSGGLSKAIGTALNYVKNLGSRIRDAAGNLGSVLYNAGKAIIDGLISGIASKFSELGNFLGSIGNFIAQHKGPPAKDALILRNAGRLIMRGLQAGMNDVVPNLASQLKGVTNKIETTVDTNVRDIPVASGNRRGNGERQVVFNVYTQEIRPEYHAQQLGELMAGTI